MKSLHSLALSIVFTALAPKMALPQTILNGSRTEDGTTWTLSTPLAIGSGPGQTGVLNLFNGGQLLAPSHNITLGTGAADASGSIVLSGTGSTLNLSGGTTLMTGDRGQGIISVSNGATLLTQTVQIAVQNGSSGAITVAGAGSTWNTRRWQMRIGMAGEGTVRLLNGAILSNTSHIIVGDESGAEGLLEVLRGSTLEMGIPTTSPFLRLGNQEGSRGVLRVDEGSRVSGTDYVHVGTSGEGILSVGANSSFAIDNTLHIGREAEGRGTVEIGDGGTFHVDGLVYVGNVGQGNLVLENGGELANTANFYAARQSTAEAMILVQGGDSLLSTGGDFRIASDNVLASSGGNAHVRIQEGGTLHAQRDLVIRQGGTVRVENGGTLQAEGKIDPGAPGDHGLLQLEGGTLLFGETFDASSPGFQWDGGTVQARGALLNLAAVPAGAALILDHGSVTGENGSLAIEAGATLTGRGFVLGDAHVASGATLRGEGGPLVVLGQITGGGTVENISRQIRPATVQNGVETSPFGTLTFSTSLDFTAILPQSHDPLFVLDLGSAEESDRIHFAGAEFRFGTHGLDLDAFAFTAHPGFDDGIYVLITSTEWLGGSLGPRTRGFVDGRPVWLRVGNDAQSLELRVGTAAGENPFVSGEVYFGRNQYTEYRAGDLPLVLTSGHDGGLRPDEIDPRTWGVTARDTNTMPQTLAVAEEIFSRTGRRPHVVLSHLHRTRLDPNREIVEAAQGNIHAEQAWSEYHEYFIQAARDASEAYAGFALVFDMHGHGHEIKRLELGYLLGRTELNVNDATLNLPGYAWQSSLRSLMLRNPGLPFTELIRGDRSLGERFNDRGVPAWPSAEFPTIGTAPFFSGGYTTRRHACHDENCPSDAIQIESHGAVRSSASARQSFAVDFVRVLQSYMYDYYGYSPGTNAFYRLTGDREVTERGGDPVTLTVHREGHRSFASTMNLGFSGTAVQGVDYTVSSETVVFATGADTATLTLLPVSGGENFGDRTVTVQLLPDYRQSAEEKPLHLTLGDGLSQTVRVHALSPTVEDGEGRAVFRFSRTRGEEALEVFPQWEGSAIPGGHYFAPDRIEFPAGSKVLDIEVPIRNHGMVEDNRVIRLGIAPSPDYLVGHPAVAETVLTTANPPRGLAVWLTDDLEGNIWKDRSGHGRHATTLPAGGGPRTMAGENQAEVRFDGQSATAALPRFQVDPDGAFSIAFAFRLDPGASTNEQNLLSYGERGEQGSLAIHLLNPTTLRTWLGQPNLPTANALNVSANWTDGQWWHYALTVSPEGTARVFINGSLARQSFVWDPPLRPHQLFWIGWNPGRRATRGFLEGSIRDFRIYSVELTRAEVRSLAEGRITLSAWKDQFDLASPDGGFNPETLIRGYVFGLPPRRLDMTPYVNHWSGTHPGITFQRQLTAGDLRYLVETSASLNPGDWEVLAELLPEEDWEIHDPDVRLMDRHGLVDVLDERPVGAEESRRFLRMRAVLDSP